jgi:propionate CoA-transferase
VNISQGAKRVVFVGTLRAGKQRVRFGDAGIVIEQEARAAKFVPVLEQISFSGEYARRWNVPVTYVTERAVFELERDGLVLTEVAPGLDVERDVLRQMDFGPRISTQLRIMDERLFREPRMGLQLADRTVARLAS